MGNFQNLKVWVRSRDLAVQVYKVTSSALISKDPGLRDQIRRASVSVPSNIAEGDALDTERQGLKHLYIARGSLGELKTQLQISNETGFLPDEIFMGLVRECDEIAAMITALIRHRSKSLTNRKGI